MKPFIKRVVRRMAKMPVIGRFVNIGIAVVRLPHFQEEQMPTLLQAISDVNHRRLEHDNFIQSVPIALRQNTLDLNKLKKTVSDVESLVAELKDKKQTIEEIKESVGYLLGRMEFVRRELMFEMRYGASGGVAEGDDQITANTKVLNQEKLEQARTSALRLNLGCGHVPLDGYLNVDRRGLPGVDIVAEIDQLPFGDDEIDELFSAHVLEHFPQEQLRRELLPYFHRLLKSGGEFRAVVPDAQAMIREYGNGNYPYDDMREVLYGGQDYDGDFHFNMFTPDSLSGLLVEAGFGDVTVIEAGRKNGKCYEFEISAKK